MEYKLSNYIVISTSLINDELKQKLIYSTRTGKIIIINEETINSIQSLNFSHLDNKILKTLIDNKVIVDKDENELDTIIYEFNERKNNNSELSIVINPSANCQLGCQYCGQIHSSINASDELSLEIFNHIKKKLSLKNYSSLRIMWYGAEPLMGINSIRYISPKLIALCKEKKINYSASMITNGLNLNERTFNDLVSNMTVKNFQITIDGCKETHDKSRYTKSGLPTFSIIMNNVINAVNNPLYKKENVSINIRINIHKNNYEDVSILIDYFHDLKIHNKISLEFAPVHDWGNNSANEKIGLPLDKFSELEIDWILRMKEKGFKKPHLIPSKLNQTCMTTTHDDELIDATGKISYCWEVPYTPDFENDNKFIVGNITDENIHLRDSSNDPLRDWYNDIKHKKNNSQFCNKCKFLPVCGGQCPISWYKGVQACPSYKFNIEDRMVIQYLSEDFN